MTFSQDFPKSLTIPPDCAGNRLDQALAQMLPQFSRNRLKQWIESGAVTVDGKMLPPKARLAGDERVRIEPPLPEEMDAPAQNIALNVVYEDGAILVIDKPAGLTVHPGAGNPRGTLMNALLHYDSTLARLPRAGIVHRLDKDTSGLMVVSRNETAHTDLVRQLAARSVKREYLALVWGDMPRDVVIEAPIGRHPVQRVKMAVVSKGKPARTHVSVEQRFGIATLLRCQLETGRTHQIRVHLASVGHSLIGDPVYGKKSGTQIRKTRAEDSEIQTRLLFFPRQALHAFRLGLIHPETRRAMQWEVSSVDDITELLTFLKKEK
jgi:23S rRNA pseudouridine1911/1915/1917 synthase